MAGLTDDKAALIQMNHAMQKVTEQMGRLAVGAANAGHAIQKDFTEQIAHFHWFASAIFDTMPFDGSRRHGAGFGGGRYFGDMESDVLRGGGGGGPGGRGGRGGRPSGFGRYPHFGPGTPPPPFYRPPGMGPSQAYADRTTDSSYGGALPYIINQGHRPTPPRPQTLGEILAYLGYKAPASQSIPSATDDELRPRRFRSVYGNPPSQALTDQTSYLRGDPGRPLPPPVVPVSDQSLRVFSTRLISTRRRSRGNRYNPNAPGYLTVHRHRGGPLVPFATGGPLSPYEPPYEPPPPRRVFVGRVPSVPLLEHRALPHSLIPYGHSGGGPLVESPWATEAGIPNAPYTRYGRPGGTILDNTPNASLAEEIHHLNPLKQLWSRLKGPLHTGAAAALSVTAPGNMGPALLTGLLGTVGAYIAGSRKRRYEHKYGAYHPLDPIHGEGYEFPYLASGGGQRQAPPNQPYVSSAALAGMVLRHPLHSLGALFGIPNLGKTFKEKFAKIWPQLPSLNLGKQIDRLTLGFKKLEEGLPPVAEFAHSTVKAGVMYGGVALQSSSPDAFATLTGSFKLLAATMGTELVPVAAHVSRGLQSAAHSFERMDPSLKKFYTNLFLLGTAAAGAIAALPRLIQFLKGLTTAAALGLEGLKGAIGFAAAHPRGAALGGAAAVGIGIGAAIYGYSAYTVNSIQESYEKASANRTNESLLRTPDRLKGTQFYQDVEQYYQKTADAEIAANRKGTRDRLYQNRIHDLNQKIAAERKELDFYTSSPIRMIGRADKIAGHEANIQHYLSQIEEAQDTRRFLEEGPAAYEKFKKAQDKKFGQVRDQAKLQGLGMLLDFQSRVQPAYYGIEDMGKKIQLEALGVSPLQEEIRRIQIQQLDVLLEIAGYSKDQAAELKRNSGLP